MQVRRLQANYAPHLGTQPAAARFGIYLISGARTGGDTYLHKLDTVAHELASTMTALPTIAKIVKRIVKLQANLRPDGLELIADWWTTATS
jgi:hypothetical protein